MNRNVCDVGMGSEGAFELVTGDILAAPPQIVLLAVDEPEQLSASNRPMSPAWKHKLRSTAMVASDDASTPRK